MGGLFVVLLLLGRTAGEALTTAAILTCPLMMVMMMFGGHQGHEEQPGSHEPRRLDETVSPTTSATPEHYEHRH
ncbi:DUF2933 domain-containing protein [Brachybacterium muris]|uniref:DUF2933 domain-containing protein n=1 Tax=Brachybacterium muris TaxID=219301 RepID=UPI0021A5CF5E|nr:DUF2933 domain-containing protein [Brachybacterium muris]MCT1430741.1 DUF2933 domain-containing protein [Brachybacterium muris]